MQPYRTQQVYTVFTAVELKPTRSNAQEEEEPPVNIAYGLYVSTNLWPCFTNQNFSRSIGVPSGRGGVMVLCNGGHACYGACCMVHAAGRRARVHPQTADRTHTHAHAPTAGRARGVGDLRRHKA